MPMRTHELHPAIVHAPLALLPVAAAVDFLAALSPRDRRLDLAGRRLWWATAGSGLVAGLAGMAASQQVKLRSDRAHDMMFLHGIGNVGLVLSALGVAVWRERNLASLTSAAAGVAAAGASMYTAWLGGELVYSHGAGVKPIDDAAAGAPALFSRQGPAALARDAARGLGWLLSRGWSAVSGRHKVDRGALGPFAEKAAEPEQPPSAL